MQFSFITMKILLVGRNKITDAMVPLIRVDLAWDLFFQGIMETCLKGMGEGYIHFQTGFGMNLEWLAVT